MWSKTEYNDYVQDTAYLMQRWLQKQTHIADHLCTFELKHIRADWSKKRRSSRGGWYRSHNGPGISIAMHHTCRPTNGQVLRWYEYSSFDKSEVIGGFYYTEKFCQRSFYFFIFRALFAYLHISNCFHGFLEGKPSSHSELCGLLDCRICSVL